MGPNGSSLLRSIGAVLHIPPRSHILFSGTQNPSNEELSLKRFEETLATRLSSLIPQEESQALTIEWLKDALQVSLATNLDAQAFIPEVQTLSKGDEKWISKYLDYSLSILNMCNKTREHIAGLDKVIMLVKLILHYVDSQAFLDDYQFDRVKDAVLECSTALKNSAKNTLNGGKTIDKTSQFLIEDMLKHSGAKSEHVLRKQSFLVALCEANVTTSVICSVVVAAFDKAGGYLSEQPMLESFTWSFALASLQKTVRAVARKRMNHSFIIPELCQLEFCLTRFKLLMDDHVSNDVDALRKELKGKTDLIKDLKSQSEVLEKSLKSLEIGVDRLFGLIMSNRRSLLDKLKA